MFGGRLELSFNNLEVSPELVRKGLRGVGEEFSV